MPFLVTQGPRFTNRLPPMAADFPPVEGVEHRFVDANGIGVHVAEAGPSGSTAPPILLLHGWPQHWYMWRAVIAGLRSGRRLLAPDLRGFGWTEAPGHGYDGETFAADQVALLDALGIERAFVVGHDWGGWTAMLLGLLHPDRVERMIACNTPHPWPQLSARLAAEAWRSWYTWVLAAPGLGRRSLEHGWIARAILTRGNVDCPFSDAEIELYVDSFREPMRADAIVHLYRYYQRAFREGLARRWRNARLTVPTLILFGERDRYVSPRLLAGHEPHAEEVRVELVPDSGHFVVNEKPELVIERARTLLTPA
jgi:pimeloyl-ACP methyl ester carboxylesterase